MTASRRRLAERALVGILIFMVRAYQLLIAPLWVGGCRHYPSCSAYAVEALQAHGAKRGTRMAIGRLLRCRPGGTYGYDPVEHVK
ncbi:MAG TPA: membrane protein insertion efficiency factor YidD [bacterium]|nr:membrane protein insertion efficiency factor YidD [bacterium]